METLFKYNVIHGIQEYRITAKLVYKDTPLPPGDQQKSLYTVTFVNRFSYVESIPIGDLKMWSF